MHIKLLSIVLPVALLVGCATSGSSPSISDAVPATDGYIEDTAGNVLLSGDGRCYRSSIWSADKQVPVCEGIEEKAEAVATAAVAPPPPPPPPPRAAPVPVPAPVAPPAPQEVERVVLNGRALFAFDSAQLTPRGESELATLISKLETYQEIEGIDIVGHTDSTGDTSYNLDLSERRAETVKSKLASAFPQVPVSASGAGEASPVASNDTAEGRRTNRRVEIRVDAINGN